MGVMMRDIDEFVRELTEGRGYVVIEGLFDLDEVAEARACILEHAAAEAPEVDADTMFDPSGHVWNLVDKGTVFERMVQEPTILRIISTILGAEVRLGSFAAKIVDPGVEAQMPHCDYPYFDLDKAETFPMGLNGSFHMNCQSTILLEDFTTENGATWVAPGSQVHGRFPTVEEFDPIAVQTTGPAGAAILRTGLLWHAAGTNRTASPRVAILGQYLPKFVTPFEDQLGGVGEMVIARASPALRSLLGVDDPYPKVLDRARA